MDGYDKNGLTPFRAWCFKNWPYLISDDMTELELLYAILGKFKEVLEEWEQMKVDWGEFQTTINEAISQMKQEIAEFEAKINQDITNIENEWSEFETKINNIVDGIPDTIKEQISSLLPDEVSKQLPGLISTELPPLVDDSVSDALSTKIGTLTPNFVSVIGPDGKITSSSNISNTELGQLDGVRSNIQEQIDSLQGGGVPMFEDLIDVVATGIDNTGSENVGAALNSLFTENPGKSFYFRNGTYNIETMLTIRGGIEIILQENAILKAVAEMPMMVFFQTVDNKRYDERIHWSGGQINGNNLAVNCVNIQVAQVLTLFENTFAYGSTGNVIVTTGNAATTVGNWVMNNVHAWAGPTIAGNNKECFEVNTTDGRLFQCNASGGKIGFHFWKGGNEVIDCESLSAGADASGENVTIAGTIGYYNQNGQNLFFGCSNDTRETGWLIDAGVVTIDACRSTYWTSEGSDKCIVIHSKQTFGLWSTLTVVNCAFDVPRANVDACIELDNWTPLDLDFIRFENNKYSGNMMVPIGDNQDFYFFNKNKTVMRSTSTLCQDVWQVMGQIKVIGTFNINFSIAGATYLITGTEQDGGLNWINAFSFAPNKSISLGYAFWEGDLYMLYKSSNAVTNLSFAAIFNGCGVISDSHANATFARSWEKVGGGLPTPTNITITQLGGN